MRKFRSFLIVLTVVVGIWMILRPNPGPQQGPPTLVHAHLGEADRWQLKSEYQEKREVLQTQPDLAAPTDFPRRARLHANLSLEAQPQGEEWRQVGHLDSIQEVHYSWDRVETRAALLTLWEAIVGPQGGLRSLKVNSSSSAPWFQPEYLVPLNASFWPQFSQTGATPGTSWQSQIPVAFRAPELDAAIDYRWECEMSWRPRDPGIKENIVAIDLKSRVSPEASKISGLWEGESLYSLPDQRVVASRGRVQWNCLAPCSQEGLFLAHSIQFNYELLRLLPEATPTPASDGPKH